MNSIDELVSQLTNEEKADLCCGMDTWHTNPIERLNIPSIMMSDGPTGVRKQEAESDHLGINESVPATCFPTSGALANSWNEDLVYQVGAALGEECKAFDVSVLLGPGINIKRSPLGGRNFEYWSEDPYLCGHLAASYINGIQSQGIGTACKHFAVNNQETGRLSINVEVDNRTLQEIYFPAFHYCVTHAKPWMIMCAYNRLNGTFGADNKWTLTDILRDEWGFEGAVVSDWGAVNCREDALIAGLDLEMPMSFGNGQKNILAALQTGKLSQEELDLAAHRLLTLIYKVLESNRIAQTKHIVPFSELKVSHHQLACKAAEESIVLLKNSHQLVPLKTNQKTAIIGSYSKSPRIQGGGSSHVNAVQIDIPYDEIEKIISTDLSSSITNLFYAEGYANDEAEKDFFVQQEHFLSNSTLPDEHRIQEAVKLAEESEQVVLFAGLPESYESESYDRIHMHLPVGQEQLIYEVAKANPNTVVVLMCGSPVEMPWISNVASVFYCGLGGQGTGKAIARLLFGLTNPSGRLAETFPQKLSDTPCYLDFPGGSKTVQYREGIFVGYRYYDSKNLTPLFPFGYGLSYTNFAYSNLTLSDTKINKEQTLQVSFVIKNTGNREGCAIPQLYLHPHSSSVVRPNRELKEFTKIALRPGEEKKVHMSLTAADFSWFNEKQNKWVFESSDFEVWIGDSSANIQLQAGLTLLPDTNTMQEFSLHSTITEIRNTTVGSSFLQAHAKEPTKEMKTFYESSPLKVFINMGNLLTWEEGMTLLDLLNRKEK